MRVGEARHKKNTEREGVAGDREKPVCLGGTKNLLEKNMVKNEMRLQKQKLHLIYFPKLGSVNRIITPG